jgi:hypothetical protein
MASLLEYVGCVHIYLGPYRGNPIALYLLRSDKECRIGPKAYPWNDVVGIGETPNKAAADFEEKWKGKGLSADMYSGPSWEGGIKPEKPKPAAPPKPAAAPATPAQSPPPSQSGPAGTGAAPKAPAGGDAGGTKSASVAPAKAPVHTQAAQPGAANPVPTNAERDPASSAPTKGQSAAKPATPTAPQSGSKS